MRPQTLAALADPGIAVSGDRACRPGGAAACAARQQGTRTEMGTGRSQHVSKPATNAPTNEMYARYLARAGARARAASSVVPHLCKNPASLRRPGLIEAALACPSA